MADAGFEYPWQYNFPPFFTIQPNLETRAAQLDAWKSLVLSYCQHHKISILDIKQALNTPLFANKELNRQLNSEGLSIILKYIEESGNLEWINSDKTMCYIYWKRPSEWANNLYKWACDKSLQNSVCTFYEILSDGEFAGLEEAVLRKAILILQDNGKAALIDFDGSEGVKFC